MKYRNGFVSNSSSSSFIAMAVNYNKTHQVMTELVSEDWMDKLWKSMGKVSPGGGYGIYPMKDDTDLIMIRESYDTFILGIDIAKRFEEGMTRDEMISFVINHVKEIAPSVNIVEKDIRLYYGETRDE